MLNSKDPDLSIFSQKVRVRVCGLLRQDDGLLMIKHHAIGKKGFLWSPPGGGVEFGDSLMDSLKREFKEETNLEIHVSGFLFINEFIGKEHHAIELFYEVQRVDGELSLGSDPELSVEDQILEKVAFVKFQVIKKMEKDHVHNIFREVNSPEDVFKLRGLFSFKL